MDRRKFLIAAGSTAVGTSALVGSGAFSSAQIRNREANVAVSADDAALIQLLPGWHQDVAGNNSTVSKSRVGYEDGQLYISFKADNQSGNGVNANSTYQVGALGQDDAEDGLDNQGIAGVSSDDALYGSAAPGPSDNEIEDDPAFALCNESDETYEFELTYDADSAPTDSPDVDSEDAAAVLVGSADDTWGAAFAMDMTDNAGRVSTELAPGECLYVSLIINVGDVDSTDTPDWEGSLVVNAGENPPSGNNIDN
ncbi:hypothetical protein HWV23_12795 [Natronomonas halophila]|uniref:hypothetical protein n=1 Tax=Natronomonas halophila TaxID=2747817 RepID=UPI0015B6D23D|nr:hypothetical protein [Natronomonas halophila]QLD86568.1 hypothetical protein HWV23_12795 [Natronomonas halophila]